MSELPTVGVEEEFLLVYPRTGEPAPHNAAVAAEAERRGFVSKSVANPSSHK